jgi:hypothetical protein
MGKNVRRVKRTVLVGCKTEHIKTQYTKMKVKG